MCSVFPGQVPGQVTGIGPLVLSIEWNPLHCGRVEFSKMGENQTNNG